MKLLASRTVNAHPTYSHFQLGLLRRSRRREVARWVGGGMARVEGHSAKFLKISWNLDLGTWASLSYSLTFLLKSSCHCIAT